MSRRKTLNTNRTDQEKITQPKPRKVKSTQTELATSEKPIQNDRGLKICAQSGSGERSLTQTEPTKKKITQSKPGICCTTKRLPTGWLPF